jgi:hypothetical protein
MITMDVVPIPVISPDCIGNCPNNSIDLWNLPDWTPTPEPAPPIEEISNPIFGNPKALGVAVVALAVAVLPEILQGISSATAVGVDVAADAAIGTADAAAGTAAESPLVYGPSAGGKLAETAARLGGETLTALDKPAELGWLEFSKQTLDAAAASGRPVIFDLTNMRNTAGVLSGTGVFANTVTGDELRYIQSSWDTFQGNVTFMNGGVTVGVPW